MTKQSGSWTEGSGISATVDVLVGVMKEEMPEARLIGFLVAYYDGQPGVMVNGSMPENIGNAFSTALMDHGYTIALSILKAYSQGLSDGENAKE